MRGNRPLSRLDHYSTCNLNICDNVLHAVGDHQITNNYY